MNKKSQITILIFLIIIFLTITLLITNNNSFVIGLDNIVHGWIANHQSPAFYNLMLSVTNIGDVLGTIIIFVVFGSFLFLKNLKHFYTFTFATASGIILTEIIKHLVQRARPINLLEQGFSFPSAHATVATIFLLSSIVLLTPVLEKRFSKIVFLLVTSVIFPLVAFSRIYLSVHFTSDVIAGIILGSITFLFACIFLVSFEKKSVVPTEIN